MARKHKRDGLVRLTSAAKECFGSKPYAEVGIAEVLEGAGVKPPSLYYHFGDKEGLFVAWAEAALGELREKTSGHNRAPGDPVDRLIEIARAIGDNESIDLARTLD